MHFWCFAQCPVQICILYFHCCVIFNTTNGDEYYSNRPSNNNTIGSRRLEVPVGLAVIEAAAVAAVVVVQCYVAAKAT